MTSPSLTTAPKPRDAAGRPPKDRALLAVAPMMPAALGVIAGIVADRFVIGWGTLAWCSWAIVGAAVAIGEGRAGRRSSLGIILAFVGVGGAWHHGRWSDLAGDDLARGFSARDVPRPCWLRGMVVEAPVFRDDPDRPGGQGTTRTVVAVTGASDGRDWGRASGKVAAWIGGDRTDLEPGRPVELAGSLAPIGGPLNPGERDARESWRAEGVRLRVAVDSASGVWDDPHGEIWPWTYRLGRVRDWAYRRLVGGLDPSVVPLASALLLGRREGVDPGLNDAFARTGTTHLLAISGLHLQALAALVWLVARAVGLRHRPALVGGGDRLGTAYAGLVGLMPSVARSLAMTLAVCLAALIDRHARPANLLATAALATLWHDPTDLFDVGCQLSFLAVAAILWGVPAVLAWPRRDPDPLDAVERHYEPAWKKRLRRAGRWLAEGVIVSTVVGLAAWPLVSLRFHISSPVGILLNLPLVPITSFAMLAAGLALGLSAVWTPLGMPAAWACRWLLGATDEAVRWGARQSWGHRFGPGPSGGWVLMFYGTLALATVASLNGWRRPARRSTWGLFAGSSLAILILPLIPPRPGRPEAEVLAVGHGLSVVVRSGDGRALLYDAGRMGDPRAGRRLIAPALWARGISKLDAIILSHADADHYDGLPDLLDRFPIASVLVPPGFAGETNPGASALLDRVRTQGIPVRTISEGDHWTLGRDVALSVLLPPATIRPGAKDNERSVVLAVESSGHKFLLTGDLEGVGLIELVSQLAPTIDALLAPHHGGRASNPPWLYDWARPGLVVASQRRPSGRDALDLVADRGVSVWRTWDRGAVNGSAGPTPGSRPTDDTSTAPPTSPDPEGRPMTLAASPTFIAVACLVGGLLAGAVLAVVEFGAWILVTPGRSLTMPADDPYPGEPIHVEAPDGVRLAGTWHGHPDAGGRSLVLLHGLAEGRQMMRARADGIYARGWNVAVLDARAYGESGGHHASFGGREVDDLRLWSDAIAARVGPGLRLTAWGRSMGAGVALRAAADDPRLRALVLEAPYIDLHRTAATLIRRYRIPGSRPLASMVLRRARRLAGVSLHRPRPIDAAPRVTIPALILRGTADALVSGPETDLLASSLGGPVERVDVEGARHSKIVDVGGPDLIDRVGDFLDRAV